MQAKAVELEQHLLQMLAVVNGRTEEEQEARARRFFFSNTEDEEAAEAQNTLNPISVPYLCKHADSMARVADFDAPVTTPVHVGRD